MNITTWNVNSLRARLDRVAGWLERNQPDLVCLQETKVEDDKFPREELAGLGYHVEIFGQKSYNGVAILSREPFEKVVRVGPELGEKEEARVLAAKVYGFRVVNLYVPNGKEVGTENYEYKLTWLDRLRERLETHHTPQDPLLLTGDFNITPDDRDVHKPERWRGKILCSEPERERFEALLDWGFKDALRLTTEEAGIFTWWDYRLNGFSRNWGLRIDHFLVTEPLAARVRKVTVDREERAGEKPSDHAPVTLTLDP